MQVALAEIEEGNVEYKRNFNNVSNSRLNQLTAQMNWRINEGNGVCYYYLGICDNGTIYENLSQEDIDYSLDIIKMMAHGCNSYINKIIINRVHDNNNYNIWFNIEIKRKNEYMNEYRILLACTQFNIRKLIKSEGYEYKKSRDIYFNTIIHNNEKYLFFECNKKLKSKISNIIDFNLIINNNNFNCLSELLNYIEKNMTGNNTINSDDVIFNIIKTNYIQSVGYIVSGFLKQGKITKGMTLESNKYNLTVQIISIHNNYIDCSEVIAPSTVSIKILSNSEINKLDGYLIYPTTKTNR
jgi:GTPase